MLREATYDPTLKLLEGNEDIRCSDKMLGR